jgi:predicted ABC-type ATPase
MKLQTLTVIGGCNGSGKSSYSRAITSKKSPSFDYDKVYLQQYNSLIDSDIRDVMAHNLSRAVLEKSIEFAVLMNQDFTYETNFNSSPLFWSENFKPQDLSLRWNF